MLYSMLGRLVWHFAKRRLRNRKPTRRQSVIAALVTAGGVAASYFAQSRSRRSRH